MFNLNSWSKVTASMPCALSQGDCLGVASLKSPYLGLQKATFIYSVWPDGLSNPGITFDNTSLEPSHPHLEPHQSIKPTRVKGTSFIHHFASDQRRQTKKLLRVWIESSSSSKAILFLAFQTIQSKCKGPAL